MPLFFEGGFCGGVLLRQFFVTIFKDDFRLCPPCLKFSSREEIIVDKDSPSRQLLSREGGERAGGGETF